MARKALTAEEKMQVDLLNQKAADNARRLFDELKERNPEMTQEKAAYLCGWTQGNLNHYLTGKAPIGAIAMKRLCALFGCQSHDIREEYKDEMHDELMMMISDALELMSGSAQMGNDELDRWVNRANKIISEENDKERQTA